MTENYKVHRNNNHFRVGKRKFKWKIEFNRWQFVIDIPHSCIKGSYVKMGRDIYIANKEDLFNVKLISI